MLEPSMEPSSTTNSRDALAAAGRTKLTPPEIARRWGIKSQKVLAWIRSGELRAINAAERPEGRARYLVDVEDLAAFERRRRVIPPAKRIAKQKRKTTNIKEYF